MKKCKCQNCGYEWETKTKLIQVTCPSCGAKTKVLEIKNKGDGTTGGTSGD